MKKRILSLVLCAAMLLSMCLFLGAGVTEDTSDTPAESTAAAQVQAPQTVVYTAAGRSCPLFRCSRFCVLRAPAVRVNSRTA